MKNNMPAFPRPRFINKFGASDSQEGMSLRDYFAGQALTGLLVTSGIQYEHENAAIMAYAFADAMLTERGKE